MIGDSHFELQFASFLEDCSDVLSYAKNYLAVHYKLDYINADGDISNYYLDFLVKLSGPDCGGRDQVSGSFGRAIENPTIAPVVR